MSDQTRPQTEQSTVLIPLDTCRVYGASTDRANTSRLDVTVVNEVKISFGAHIYENNQYRNVSCSMYSIEIFRLLDKIKELIASPDKSALKIELNNKVVYDNVTRDGTLVFKRDNNGIWSITIASSAKGHCTFAFNGIKNTHMAINGAPQSPQDISAEHLKSWMSILIRMSSVAMSILAQEKKRELPPFNGNQAVSN